MLKLITDTNINISSSNIRHGVGLFETIRIINGIPMYLDKHLERLNNGTAFFNMDIPPTQEIVLSFLKNQTSCFALKSGVMRLIAVDKCLHVLISNWHTPYFDKIELGISNTVTRFSKNLLNNFKTLSYAENRLLFNEAHKRRLYDIVALNELGHLTDCSRTNIFLVKEQSIITPAISSGALPGIIRRILLEKHLVCEADITLSDLLQAKAVFLTNALHGIIIVNSIITGNNYDTYNLDTHQPVVCDMLNLFKKYNNY